MSTNDSPSDTLPEDDARSAELAAALERGVGELGDLAHGPLSIASDEFFVLSTDGSIVDVNRRACDELGFTRDELIGRSVWSISTRQTPEGFQKLVEAIEAEGPQYLFGHNRRKDGSTYAVEARLWLADHDGRPHVFGILRDSRGYRGLIEERDQLISLIENSAEAIIVATPDGTCSYMNPAGREMLGMESLSDVVGKSLTEMTAVDQRQIVIDDVLPAVRRGRWQGELSFRRFGTDDVTPCSLNAFAVKHSQTGEVLGLAVIAHDISERKSAERQRERLLQLNEVSRKVANSLLDQDDLNEAIGIILSGVGRILNVSRSYLCRYREAGKLVFRTHQWTAEDGELHLIEPRPEPAATFAWVTEILTLGKYVRVPDVSLSGVVPREGSGVLRPDVHALLIMPVIIHGRLESFFGFVDTSGPRDWQDEELALLQIITDSFSHAVERRIAERERSEIAADLEESVARERVANRYKSEFLANMSHELRTPMNAIVGYAELLSRPNVDGEKQATWIGHIRRSTDYLLSLINDVLDLSKIEAGHMSVSKERCSLPDLVSNVEELLEGQAREKLLALEFEFEDSAPEWIETDPVRFRQVLVNLVGNAIKFTDSGSVSVRVRSRAGTNSDCDELIVDIIDTGIGIDEESIKDLFRPFSQVHNPVDTRFSGTGLGLEISRHLARLLGGDIEVVSNVGHGSVFTFSLMLQNTLAANGEAPSVEERDRATGTEEEPISFVGRKILIVDDCPENREVLQFLLSESGSAVEVAENGERGVEMAQAASNAGRPYDAVLMDMNMPVLDGYEATRRLVSAGFEPPIIALTALALAGDEENCRAAGCVDYISKPVLPTKFFATIAQHLRRSDVPIDVGKAEPADNEFSLVGNPRFQPLIERYVASFESLLPELRAYFDAQDLQRLRTRVHRLRGTAANYGYPEISSAAGVCEDHIRADASTAVVESALQQLEELLRTTFESFDSASR